MTTNTNKKAPARNAGAGLPKYGQHDNNKDYTRTEDRNKVFDLLLEKPIAFHKVFKIIAGNSSAAIFLSQAFYWSKNKTAIGRGGWFIKSRREWEDETGLTRSEQETARRICRDLGVIEEKLRRWNGHATLHFRLNKSRVFDLIEQSPRLRKARQLIDCRKPANYSLRKTRNLLTENTQRIPPIGGNFKTWKDTPEKYHPYFEAMIEGTKNPEPKGQKTISEWVRQFEEQLEIFGEWLTPKRVRDAIREFARQKGSTANILRPKSITHILVATFDKTRKPAPVRSTRYNENGELIYD